jgi:hypothetical protein
MLSANFSSISHIFSTFEAYVPAIVITVAAAVLVGCAVSGVCSPCKEKDQVFRKHVW